MQGATESSQLRREDAVFVGAGGIEIFRQAWLPATDGEVRARLVIAHGVSEHSGRYDWTATQLNAHGISVDALDHRGHGRSQGPRALIDRIDNAIADIDTLIDIATAREPGLPVFLLGHSMGGCLAIAYACAHQERLAGLVLSAPLAALEAASLPQRLAAQVISAVAPRFGLFPVDADAVSRNPAVVADYEADPLNHHGKLPARTVVELVNAIKTFETGVPTLSLPILAMHGTADTLTPIAGSEMVVAEAASTDKHLSRYEGLYHELVQEPERDQVVAEIADWITARA